MDHRIYIIASDPIALAAAIVLYEAEVGQPWRGPASRLVVTKLKSSGLSCRFTRSKFYRVAEFVPAANVLARSSPRVPSVFSPNPVPAKRVAYIDR